MSEKLRLWSLDDTLLRKVGFTIINEVNVSKVAVYPIAKRRITHTRIISIYRIGKCCGYFKN